MVHRQMVQPDFIETDCTLSLQPKETSPSDLSCTYYDQVMDIVASLWGNARHQSYLSLIGLLVKTAVYHDAELSPIGFQQKFVQKMVDDETIKYHPQTMNTGIVQGIIKTYLSEMPNIIGQTPKELEHLAEQATTIFLGR